MSAPHWVVNLERWPVAIVEVVGADGKTPPVLATFMECLDQILSRQTRCAIVFDLTHARPDAARRAALTAYLKENDARIRANVARMAVVAPSALQRGFVIALQWVGVDYGIVPFETRADALVWARMGLGEDG